MVTVSAISKLALLGFLVGVNGFPIDCSGEGCFRRIVDQAMSRSTEDVDAFVSGARVCVGPQDDPCKRTFSPEGFQHWIRPLMDSGVRFDASSIISVDVDDTQSIATFVSDRSSGLLYRSPLGDSWSLMEYNVTFTGNPAGPPPVTSRLDADVWSFNLRYGSANDGTDSWPFRWRQVMDLLDDSHADFIGMQEVLDFQLEEILEKVPRYDHVGVGRDDGVSQGEFSPILFDAGKYRVLDHGTFWFCDQPDRPGCTSYGNSIPRICTWGLFEDIATSVPLYLYNLHIDHNSATSRYESVSQLLRTIEEDAAQYPPGQAPAVLVTGDFNAGESSPEVLLMSAHGFVDTFRVVHPDATEVGTFHSFTGATGGAKIDYVFSPSTETSTSTTPTTEHSVPQVVVRDANINHSNVKGKYPSDHFPVDASVTVEF
eukprot:Rmarinus@m.4185